MTQAPPKISAFFSILIFLGGLVLAGALPPLVSETAIQLQWQLTLFMLVILLGFPQYRLARLEPKKFEGSRASLTWQPLSLIQYCLRLFALQGLLFYLSLCCFYALEAQTRLNPKLQPLREGQIFEVLQGNFFQTSYIPFMLYAVMALGLLYFTVCRGRYPTLPKAIIPKPRNQLQWVIHNYLNVVIDAVMLAPFIWLLSLAIIGLCEGFNGVLNQESLLETPFKTMSTLGLLYAFLNRTHRSVLDAMERFKIPLGIILVLYVIFIAILMVSLKALVAWLMLSIGNPDAKPVKSLMAQALTEGDQGRRLAILLWTWWVIWTPWMVSQIARLSLGRKLWEACLLALIVPTVFWLWWQYGNAAAIHSKVFALSWQWPFVKLMTAVFILSFLFYFFRRVYSTQDLERGGLLQFGRVRQVYSLRKWMNGLIILMLSYMLALFMIGWLSVQILNTLGALFMLTVLFSFVWVLLSSSDFLSVLKKYRARGTPEY